jgi:hypothetical protein
VALSKHEEFRRAIRDLNLLAKADMDLLWRTVRDARDAKEALMDLLPEVVDTYGLAAGSIAADYYDGLREEAAVYSESSVEFAAHDNDKCGAAPAFNSEQIKAVKSEYVPSAKRRAEATKARENAAARDWIANNL